MIIILIFKAAWYNEYLSDVVKAGRPNNHCPAGNYQGFTDAQLYLDQQRQIAVDALYNAYKLANKVNPKSLVEW